MRLPKKHLRREEQGAKVRGQENINIYGVRRRRQHRRPRDRAVRRV